MDGGGHLIPAFLGSAGCNLYLISQTVDYQNNKFEGQVQYMYLSYFKAPL